MIVISFVWVLGSAATLFVPGFVVLWVGLGLRFRLALACAPAATVGTAYMTATVCGVTGLSFGLFAALIGTAVISATSLLLRSRFAGGPRLALPALDLPGGLWWIGSLAGAAAVGGWTYLRGLGSVLTLPQEHDMVLQTLLVSYIDRSGKAAPWQSSPVDLISGEPAGFYPNGMHMVAALATTNPSQAVASLNAITITAFALVLPLGVAAVTCTLVRARYAHVASAVAAIVSVVAYRPVFAFLHDGGVLANAFAFALTPAVMALALTAVRSLREDGAARRNSSHLAALVLTGVGVGVAHPTALVVLVVSVAPVVLATLVVDRRRWTWRGVALVGAAGLGAAAILVPFLAAASQTAGFVTAFPDGTSGSSLGAAIGTTTSFYYGGYFDPAGALSQVVLAALSVGGVLLSIWRRANSPLLLVYGTWLFVLLVWLMYPTAPVIGQVAGLFYNNYGRFSIGLSLAQWVAVGAAVAVATSGLGAVVRSRPAIATARLHRVLPATIVLAVGLLLVVSYAPVNATSLAQRYEKPDFVRVDDDDLAVGRYVAERIAPGERVLNNANDGSTYSYIFYGLPIVETSTLGSPYAPYTTDLLLRIDELGRGGPVDQLVCDLSISWVIVDLSAPTIGAPPEVTPLSDDGSYSVPEAFRDLDRVAMFEDRFSRGPVTAYAVDTDRLNCSA